LYSEATHSKQYVQHQGLHNSLIVFLLAPVFFFLFWTAEISWRYLPCNLMAA